LPHHALDLKRKLAFGCLELAGWVGKEDVVADGAPAKLLLHEEVDLAGFRVRWCPSGGGELLGRPQGKGNQCKAEQERNDDKRTRMANNERSPTREQ
jgi:hypothetical protein